MRDDKQTKKTMLYGFVIICICCGIMHRILVNKGNLYIERAAPRYTLDKKDTTGEMKEGVGVVSGKVTAVSYDKFFLEMPDERIQEILVGELNMPKIGTRIDVTYAGGEPPKALMVKVLKIGP